MTTKLCTKCKKYKDILEFGNNKLNKDGLYHYCKFCVSEINTENRKKHSIAIKKKKKEYYEKNKQEILKKSLDKYNSNKDAVLYRAKNYYNNNKEEVKRKTRQYRQVNADIVKEKDKKKYMLNREKAINQARESYIRMCIKDSEYNKKKYARNIENNRLSSRIAGHIRRAKERSGDVTNSQVLELFNNSKGKCYWCGCIFGSVYHLDHYIPLSKGGIHTISNLVISCKRCNLQKSAKDPYKFALSRGKLF